MEKQNEIAILLTNRTYLYRLFQNTFGAEPSAELVRALTNEHTLEALKLPVTKECQGILQYLPALKEMGNWCLDDKDKVLASLTTEYTRLFLGPTKLPAPPWESVYVSKEPLLFQESTLTVRRSYLKHGFIPQNYPHEADDHLALELDFMASLSGLAHNALEQSDFDKVTDAMEDQKAFLEDHLLKWIPQFAAKLNASDTYAYGNLAHILREFLILDTRTLAEIIPVLKSEQS